MMFTLSMDTSSSSSSSVSLSTTHSTEISSNTIRSSILYHEVEQHKDLEGNSIAKRPRVSSSSSIVTSTIASSSTLPHSVMDSDYLHCNGIQYCLPYFYSWIVPVKERWIGNELQTIFRNEFSMYSLTYLYTSIEQGTVLINYKRTVPSYILRSNDILIHTGHRHEVPILQATINLQYDTTQNYIVINKPPSWPVHATNGYNKNSLLYVIEKQLEARNNSHISNKDCTLLSSTIDTPRPSSLFLLHRIDRLVSGLVLLATNNVACKFFTTHLVNQNVKKVYLSKVIGQCYFNNNNFNTTDSLSMSLASQSTGTTTTHHSSSSSSQSPGTTTVYQTNDITIQNLKEWKDIQEYIDERSYNKLFTIVNNETVLQISSVESFSSRTVRLFPTPQIITLTFPIGKLKNKRFRFGTVLPSSTSFSKLLSTLYRLSHTVSTSSSSLPSYLQDLITQLESQEITAPKVSKTIIIPLYYDTNIGTTTVLLLPVTGRTHQLRVHLQSIGYPIANDNDYGGNRELYPDYTSIINNDNNRVKIPHGGIPRFASMEALQPLQTYIREQQELLKYDTSIIPKEPPTNTQTGTIIDTPPPTDLSVSIPTVLTDNQKYQILQHCPQCRSFQQFAQEIKEPHTTLSLSITKEPEITTLSSTAFSPNQISNSTFIPPTPASTRNDLLNNNNDEEDDDTGNNNPNISPHHRYPSSIWLHSFSYVCNEYFFAVDLPKWCDVAGIGP